MLLESLLGACGLFFPSTQGVFSGEEPVHNLPEQQCSVLLCDIRVLKLPHSSLYLHAYLKQYVGMEDYWCKSWTCCYVLE